MFETNHVQNNVFRTMAMLKTRRLNSNAPLVCILQCILCYFLQ